MLFQQSYIWCFLSRTFLQNRTKKLTFLRKINMVSKEQIRHNHHEPILYVKQSTVHLLSLKALLYTIQKQIPWARDDQYLEEMISEKPSTGPSNVSRKHEQRHCIWRPLTFQSHPHVPFCVPHCSSGITSTVTL